MEVLIGITGADFTITAGDASVLRSVVCLKRGEVKSRNLNNRVIMNYTGEQVWLYNKD